MEPTLPHPFYKHPESIEIPKDKVKDIDEIYSWIKTQTHFPKFSYNHAYLFGHACLWDMTATKKAITKYSSIRSGAPDIFDKRDPLSPASQFVFNMSHMIAMPKPTPEGYKILIYRLSNPDPSKVNFGEAVKSFCMFNDVCISEDGICDGYIVVFDMKGLKLGHLARVQLGPLRTYMAYIQEAHPVRLKKIYIVHSAIFINQIMSIVKPLIQSELLGLLQFTTGGPADVLPLELLPEDYGGHLDKIENYHNEQRKKIETIYRDWIIDSSNLKELPKEKKEKGKNKNNNNNNINKNEMKPIETSFGRLEID